MFWHHWLYDRKKPVPLIFKGFFLRKCRKTEGYPAYPVYLEKSLMTWALSVHGLLPFIITQPQSWFSFYRSVEGGQLSWPRHCTKVVPRAEYRSAVMVIDIDRLNYDAIQCPTSVLVRRCLQSRAPLCLMECCIPVSDMTWRQHRRSASCTYLTTGVRC